MVMTDKKTIITILKLSESGDEIYIYDDELGYVKVVFKKIFTFKADLYKYEGLKAKVTIYNPNDEDQEIMGFPLYAKIDEIL